MPVQSGYYRHPTIHGDLVVFVCEDDLWATTTAGGVARRLTATTGRITFPRLSPDGSRIAFTGRDEGPEEAYAMDADGGVPRRLTHYGCTTQTVGWRPGGKAVVCATAHEQFHPGQLHLHAVPLDGSPARPLKVGPARAITFEPDGKGVAIGRNSGDPARWKRYRGGTAGTLWVDRNGKGRYEPLIRLAGNLANPMWIGNRIYFLSDHEGHGNLYSCTPTGRGLARHTHHEDYYVRFPASDGTRIVYHAGADLHVFDPAANEARRIEVSVKSPRAALNRKFVGAAEHLETYDLHPQGHSIALVSRGGAFSMGLWDGVPTRHGEPSRERRRLATWVGDGKDLVTVADKGGEEGLVVHRAAGSARGREVKGDLGRAVAVAAAPAGAPRLAIANHRQELLLVDLQSRRVKTVDRSAYDRIQGLAWSPDGRYLAYGYPPSRTSVQIRVFDTTSGRTRDVTRPGFQDVEPAFDPEGRYLYFLSYRVFDPVMEAVYFDLGFPRGSRPHLVTLARDEPSPFEAAHRPPRGPAGTPEGDDAKKQAAGAKPPKVTIHFDGIEDRVVAFPVAEGRYTRIQGAPRRALFTAVPVEGMLEQPWPDTGAPAAKARLAAWDFDKDKEETVYDGVSSFRLSADGKILAVRIGNRLRVLPATVKAEALPKGEDASRESGWIDLDRLRLEVHPADEWRQMFREAWRLQRDHFWDPGMTGVDWEAVHDRYLPLVDRVACRAEFSDLLWEMQGELGTSHCYEMGGDYRPVPQYHLGHLGADLEFDREEGAWRIARIPRGDSWDPKRASPLSAPGLRVSEGDEIVSVAGTKVGRKRPPARLLVHRAGQPVEIGLRDEAGKTRTVVVRTLESEHPLRYRDWVETNRARVHDATDGRVGYVHVPDMGAQGYSEFHRYYLGEVEHDGLIVDVRYNGGGFVSQLLLQKLLRKRIGYDKTRWQAPFSYPAHAPMGPMVALTNEYAGSDGDIFSHGFKAYGLGPLIGKRTWGGVVGIWPRHALVDGTITTQPEFGTWFEEVTWGVENYGVDPDIEVEIRPQDHAAGKDPQLDRALAEIKGILKRVKPKMPALDELPDLKPPRLPPA